MSEGLRKIVPLRYILLPPGLLIGWVLGSIIVLQVLASTGTLVASSSLEVGLKLYFIGLVILLGIAIGPLVPYVVLTGLTMLWSSMGIKHPLTIFIMHHQRQIFFWSVSIYWAMAFLGICISIPGMMFIHFLE